MTDTYESDIIQSSETEYDSEVEEFIDEVENRDIYHKKMIIIEPRLTMARLSRFEMCEIVSIRAEQISKNDIVMVDKGTLDSPIELAKKELMRRKSPLVLRRKVGELYDEKTKTLTEYYEYWNVNDMSFPVKYDI